MGVIGRGRPRVCILLDRQHTTLISRVLWTLCGLQPTDCGVCGPPREVIADRLQILSMDPVKVSFTSHELLQ